jgi:hypothetical protein
VTAESKKQAIRNIQARMDIAFASLATMIRERQAAQAALADMGSRLEEVVTHHRELRKELQKLEA